MLVMRAIEDPTDPIGKLVGAQQAGGLNHLAFAVYPLGLYGVKPRTLLRKKATEDSHSSFATFFTSRLCLPRSQRLTSLETCQLALSQIRSRTFLPRASSFSQLH